MNKLVNQLKNGNPMTKALVVFMMAPKGMLIFGPLLIKKYVPAGVLAFICSR